MPVPTTPSGQIEYLNSLYRGASAVQSPQTVAPPQQIPTAQWVQAQKLAAAAAQTADPLSRPTLPGYPVEAMQAVERGYRGGLPSAAANIPQLADKSVGAISSGLSSGKLSAVGHALRAPVSGGMLAAGGLGAAMAAGGSLLSGSGPMEAIGAGVGSGLGYVGGAALGGALGAIAGPGGAAVGAVIGGAIGGGIGGNLLGTLGRLVDDKLGIGRDRGKNSGASPPWVNPAGPILTAGGLWTVPTGQQSGFQGPQGADGVRYNVVYADILINAFNGQPFEGSNSGVELDAPFRFAFGGTSLQLFDRNNNVVSSRSTSSEIVGYILRSATPLTPEPPPTSPTAAPDLRPSTPPLLPALSDYPQPPSPDDYPGMPLFFPPSLTPDPAPQPKAPNQQSPDPAPAPQPLGESSPAQPQPQPGTRSGSGFGGALGQGVRPDEIVEYVPGIDWSEFNRPAFERDPVTGGLLQVGRDVTNSPATNERRSPSDLQQAGIIAATGAVLATTAVVASKSLNPRNPISNQGNLNLVPLVNPVPTNTPTSPANPGQNAPTCRYDALGISGKVDNANTTLNAVQIFQQEQIMGRLNTIDNKLGAQIPDGGIGGLLGRLWDYSKKAWEATRIDKALNALNFLLVLHNAAMLSRNLGETLGELTGQALSVIGIKDEQGNAIDINQLLGQQANNLMSSILGAETWTGVKESFNKASRILSAASNIVWTIRSIADSSREISEWIAENTGKIGNALKRWRVVGENAYSWMPERVNAQSAWERKVRRYQEGVDSLDDAASSFSSVLSEVGNIQEEGQELLEQYQRFNQAVESLEPKERPKNMPVYDRETESKANSATPNPITADDKAKGDAP